jgi:hypothetical protein
MPARKKPVSNRDIITVVRLLENNSATLKSAPKIALRQNTFEGENLSEIVNRAKIKVPQMKPSCTAEVTWASEFAERL